MKKVCSKCNIKKDLSNYCKDKNWLNWVRSVCKKCGSIWNKERYINKKDEIREKQISYKKTEDWKELIRLSKSKRRANIKNTSDNTITLKNTKELLEKQDYKCNFCKIDIKDRSIRHLDHIYPLSKWWIHSINNVQWLCCKCNLEKYNKII